MATVNTERVHVIARLLAVTLIHLRRAGWDYIFQVRSGPRFVHSGDNHRQFEGSSQPRVRLLPVARSTLPYRSDTIARDAAMIEAMRRMAGQRW
jgi:hypothetical protein